MIDIDKLYETKDGKDVVLTFMDGHGNHPVHGRYHDIDGWHICTWNENGYYGSPDRPNNLDLVEINDE